MTGLDLYLSEFLFHIAPIQHKAVAFFNRSLNLFLPTAKYYLWELLWFGFQLSFQFLTLLLQLGQLVTVLLELLFYMILKDILINHCLILNNSNTKNRKTSLLFNLLFIHLSCLGWCWFISTLGYTWQGLPIKIMYCILFTITVKDHKDNSPQWQLWWVYGQSCR